MLLKANTRQIGGKKAQAWGAYFEKLFESTAMRANLAVTRIPDGCKYVGGITKTIRVKSPFDWILTGSGKTALLDTKTMDADTFPYSKISKFQVHCLFQHASSLPSGYSSPTKGGYVIWMRPMDRVFFVSADVLIQRVGIRGSFDISELERIGRYLGSHRDMCLAWILE